MKDKIVDIVMTTAITILGGLCFAAMTGILTYGVVSVWKNLLEIL